MTAIAERAQSDTQPCENCGSLLVEAFCASCGQRRLSPRRPLGAVISDAIGTVFALDSKFLRTLRDLFFRPGAVTRGFIEGKRERYSPPFRLFFFASVAFFFYLNYSAGDGRAPPAPLADPPAAADAGSAPPKPVDIEINTGIPMLKSLERDLNARIARTAETCSADSSSCFKHFASQFQWIVYIMAPLFGLAMALLTAWRGGHFAVDSIVYSLNNHSFVFFFMLLSEPIGWIPFAGPFLEQISGLYLVYWFIASFRRVYATKWLTAISGSFVLLMAWALVFVLAILTTLVVGLFTA